MPTLTRAAIALKALRQLGIQQVGLYALYKIGLASGHFRRETDPGGEATNDSASTGGSPSAVLQVPLFELPSRAQILAVIGPADLQVLLSEADEITAGKVRLFGAQPVELKLAFPAKLAHWTAYETGSLPLPTFEQDPANLPTGDVKRLWEPARFGWAFTLGRAWHLTGDEKYPIAFWQYYEIFSRSNPPYLGPNWMSGQEVALRLMALLWAGQIFENAQASTPERMSWLAASVAAHAGRIPCTLIYARSLHNNHLLSEAAGLFTAALALPGHPEASRWRSLGWRWLNAGFQSQIDGYGEYAQHSTNYHRLMLQIALWVNALAQKFDLRWPRQTQDALGRSVHWLLSLLDSESGRVPNLGANDGAYLFPLTICPFDDHRPVVHAAARAFLNYELPGGPWDEMSLWFNAQARGPRSLTLGRYLGDQVYGRHSWAYLRTAQFSSRPSHADQLHLDLWWRGLNVARDAGTYLYQAEKPWDNALTTTLVHNTVSLDGKDQFTRAGRFLFLDWFNAYRQPLPVEAPGELQRVRGRYRRGGFRHTRIVSVLEQDQWRVVDEILPLGMPWQKKTFTARLHWLLPDWEWDLEKNESKTVLRLSSPHGRVSISFHNSPGSTEAAFSLFRAGELLQGSAPPGPTRGWTSPSYSVKIPALSLAVTVESQTETTFTTEFSFPVQV